jgi:hypothetical protein
MSAATFLSATLYPTKNTHHARSQVIASVLLVVTVFVKVKQAWDARL